MKRLKLLGIASALVFAGAFIFAQDSDFSDDFSSDFGNDFGSDFGDSSSSSFSMTQLEVSGEAELNFRAYFDDDEHTQYDPLSPKEWESEATPKGKVNLKYSNDSVSAEIKFALSKDILDEYHGDVIDEMTLESYLGNFTVQAGKMKVVWGKGDKLHAIDNFNANDYTDFVISDYIDRRIAEPMVRVLYNVPTDVGPFSSSRFEVVWTPFFTPDRYAESGRWVPAQVSSLTSGLTSIAGQALVEQGVKARDESSPAYSEQALYTTMVSNATTLADNIYPDTYKLKYMQAGARFTTTTGSLDWGISYYAGRDKTASIDYTKMNSFVTKHLAGTADDDDKFIGYDFMQVFGIEAAKTFGAYNFRAEGAYNLTEDTDGDDPAVHNNSISWVAGFDRDLPISELNVNFQAQGKFIVHKDKIDDNGELDTEDGSFRNDVKLVLNISDSLAHSKVKPEVTAIYGLQHYDLIVIPKLTWYVSDGLEFSALGMYMASFDEDKTEFPGWHNNCFAQIGAKYTF